VLSQREVAALTCNVQEHRLFDLFKRCALAVLNTGNEDDDAAALYERYADFEIEVAARTRGLTLNIKNAPDSAFVDGKMVEGIRQHLFAVLRDIVYLGTEVASERFDFSSSEGITDAVFHILKHARVLNPDLRPNLVVCWGGHSISREEYDYSKRVGYELGLRRLDVCTGCGPGAMKGPMKGAAVGHAKQRYEAPRYIGLTEPGIIAAEPPNPMVNRLVILPDIEKRLEAFLRIGHGVVVFPGGVGTAEEILYLMGLLLDPANARIELPVVFTGPSASAEYFAGLDEFLRLTLGEDISTRYQIVIDDAPEVGRVMAGRLKKVLTQRRRDGDAFYFNWLLSIGHAHQLPFVPTHEAVRSLRLSQERPAHELAVALRRAFSAIVSGNVKADGIHRIRRHGPFEIVADGALMEALDALLRRFVAQGRMRLGGEYTPCYRVVAA